ncbi:MAG TPA: hypothetical protein VKQ32_14260 [Polyangia bacterium]|nr:hypothetical protein [Polyangia bacterium]
MFQVAPSVLFIAAVAATQPVPAKRRLTDDEKRAADSYVKAAYAWIDDVSARCLKIGYMLSDVMHGIASNGDATRAEIKSLQRLFDAKARPFDAAPSPKFAEMVAFRRLYLDFVAMQRPSIERGLPAVLALAEDRRLPEDERVRQVLAKLHEQDFDGPMWTGKLDAAKKAVDAALKRR